MKGTGFLLLMFIGAGLLLLSGGSVIGSAPPFPTDKLSVLVIEETAERGSYTADQRNVITATGPNSIKGKVEAKGGRFHSIDESIPPDKLSLAPQWVQDAFKVKRDGRPWIAGATPKRGFSMKLDSESDVAAKVEGM